MNKRIFAFMIDYLICCVIQAVLMIIFVFTALMNNPDPTNVFGKVLIITLISITYLIIRDALFGRSIGKIIFKLEIINSSNTKAGFIQKIVRNITFILGPVELIFFIIKKQRIGDLLAKTEVREIQN